MSSWGWKKREKSRGYYYDNSQIRCDDAYYYCYYDLIMGY
jgi:hypothetical protein